MALTSQSFAAAARKKAQRAHAKVMAAKSELAAANRAFEEALPAKNLTRIRRAAKRTVTAEAHVEQAAEELEAVTHLLDSQLEQQAAAANPAGASQHSGQGLKSLLPHLNRKGGVDR